MLSDEIRQDVATALRHAELTAVPIAPLEEHWPEIDVADAYGIQLSNVAQRIQNGASVRGHKVGLSSRAMQQMLGVDEPDYGHLLDDMFLFEGFATSADRYCSPRVEVEVGFVLGDSLPSGGCTVSDVLRATEFVLPCIEVIDSRIQDWKITLAGTIADNASAAAVVMGGVRVPPDRLDLRTIGAVLRRNGGIVDTGCSGAVLGNPATAVAWLANKVAQFGVTLQAGNLILPGSCTRAHPVSAGDHIHADFDSLGHVAVSFT